MLRVNRGEEVTISWISKRTFSEGRPHEVTSGGKSKTSPLATAYRYYQAQPRYYVSSRSYMIGCPSDANSD